MINIIGTYECKADAKGRIMLPSSYKKQLFSIIQEGFIVKRSVFQSCLELYTVGEWNIMMAKINKLNRFKKVNNDFIRRFTAGVKMVDVDSSGRFLIPKDLCVFAQISKSVVLSSMGNIIEVWDKNKYEKVINEVPSDFADLAEQVMGDFETE